MQRFNVRLSVDTDFCSQTIMQDMWHTDIVLAVDIVFVHQLEQLYFDLCLIIEWLLVLDDLDSHLLLLHCIVRFHHLHNMPSTYSSTANHLQIWHNLSLDIKKIIHVSMLRSVYSLSYKLILENINGV